MHANTHENTQKRTRLENMHENTQTRICTRKRPVKKNSRKETGTKHAVVQESVFESNGYILHNWNIS